MFQGSTHDPVTHFQQRLRKGTSDRKVHSCHEIHATCATTRDTKSSTSPEFTWLNSCSKSNSSVFILLPAKPQHPSSRNSPWQLAVQHLHNEHNVPQLASFTFSIVWMNCSSPHDNLRLERKGEYWRFMKVKTPGAELCWWEWYWRSDCWNPFEIRLLPARIQKKKKNIYMYTHTHMFLLFFQQPL